MSKDILEDNLEALVPRLAFIAVTGQDLNRSPSDPHAGLQQAIVQGSFACSPLPDVRQAPAILYLAVKDTIKSVKKNGHALPIDAAQTGAYATLQSMINKIGAKGLENPAIVKTLPKQYLAALKPQQS